MLSLVRQPRWLALVALTAVFTMLFWWLGAWQLDRHQERVTRNNQVRSALDAPVQPLTAAMPDPSQLPAGIEHRRVETEGRYLKAAQLLQRNPSGRAGFGVLTPLELASGGTLLVNRGFVRLSRTDPNAPDAAADLVPPAGEVTVIVRLRAPEISDGREAPEGQVYDIDPANATAFSQNLPGLPPPIYAAYGELVEQEPAGGTDLERPAPADLGMGPHLFYAIQWWLLIPIAVGGLVLLLRREVRDGRTDTPATPQDAHHQPQPR